MLRLRLIHWNAAEADRYLTLFKEAGHRVEYSPEFSPQLMREWRASPPDAFIIDLSRLPSHGREIAIALRQSKATRRIPSVFCEGEEEKVAKTRALLPDAVYCEFSRLKSSLRDGNSFCSRDSRCSGGDDGSVRWPDDGSEAWHQERRFGLFD